MELEDNNPLVTIIVITYNSSKFVLETLESAKAQTYGNIELIIADDASQDDTVNNCKDWLEKNKERFVRTELVEAERNTGISANCNRGLKVCKGTWLKFIAGDDILTVNSIENNLRFCAENNEILCVFSKYQIFNHEFSLENLDRIYPEDESHYFFSDKITAKEQYDFVINGTILWQASTFFCHRSIIYEVGGFDERYFAEDVIYTYILEKNFKMYFNPVLTVYKRRHALNIGNSLKYYKGKIIQPYYQGLKRFEMDYLLSKVGFYKKINILYSYFFYKMVFFLGNKGKVSWFIYRYFCLIAPSLLIKIILLKFFKNIKS